MMGMGIAQLRTRLRKRLAQSWRIGAVLLAAAVLFLVATRWHRWETLERFQSTDDAYLQSDLTPVVAKVSGYIRYLPMQDYQQVRAGQLLAEIIDDDYRAAVAQYTAAVAAASAQLDVLKAQREVQAANVDAARATVAAVRANLVQNGRDLARQKQLLATGSSSTEAAEKLQTTHLDLETQLQKCLAQVQAAERELAVLAAQKTLAAAQINTQRANLQAATITLGYTRITAPQDGVLGERQIKPGQYVPVGGQITTLTPLPHLWVIANYKETQLTRMRLGRRAQIEVDTFPGRRLTGHVLAFAPASGAQFSLLPPDNATGNFTKIVQRIAVKIGIDDADGLAELLRPGMSVVTTVDTRENSHP
jgi:membrane fusion protein (multidrug efflux system)